MKYFRSLVGALALSAALLSCSNSNRMVEIETPYGSMKVLLYDDTPLHRDNFLRLAESGQYDSLLFHRVVRGYTIQGGDPLSRNDDEADAIGSGNIGDPIDAEILYPQHFHKKGALCAARMPDEDNPSRQSCGSQFFIVHGTVQTPRGLDNKAVIRDNINRQRLYKEVAREYEDSLAYLESQNRQHERSEMQFRMLAEVERRLEEHGRHVITDEMRDVYCSLGGVPEFDGDYTVFGEVVEGLNVIDSIAQAPVKSLKMMPSRKIWMVVRPID